MNIAFYSGVSGLIAYQEEIDQIAHNVANANTAGYKPARSAFSDLLYSRMAVNSPDEHLVGHGVRTIDADLLMRQGTVQPTGQPLDFALIGEGFFAVETASGEVAYTRKGNFDVSLSGRRAYLVSSDDGAFVLNARGRRISLTRNADDSFDLSGIVGELGIYLFGHPHAVEPVSGSRFRPTDESGDATAYRVRNNQTPPYTIVSQALEQSGVNLADEMTNAMITQKAYQFSAKMVQTADALEEIINNLR